MGDTWDDYMNQKPAPRGHKPGMSLSECCEAELEQEGSTINELRARVGDLEGALEWILNRHNSVWVNWDMTEAVIKKALARTPKASLKWAEARGMRMAAEMAMDPDLGCQYSRAGKLMAMQEHTAQMIQSAADAHEKERT